MKIVRLLMLALTLLTCVSAVAPSYAVDRNDTAFATFFYPMFMAAGARAGNEVVKFAFEKHPLIATGVVCSAAAGFIIYNHYKDKNKKPNVLTRIYNKFN